MDGRQKNKNHHYVVDMHDYLYYHGAGGLGRLAGPQSPLPRGGGSSHIAGLLCDSFPSLNIEYTILQKRYIYVHGDGGCFAAHVNRCPPVIATTKYGVRITYSIPTPTCFVLERKV
jgi:hypothetical protein